MIPGPFDVECDACGAVPGQDCRPGCIGHADMLDRAEAILARAFTVETSKLYARLSHPSNGCRP